MESNVSLNVTYTLKCPGDADSIAELSASGEFSLCGANAYTFSMGFYYTSTDSGVLFAQGNLFTLSILNSKLALNIKNLTNIPIDVGGFFIANAFNNIDITYDRSVVTLYLNGMAAFSKQVTASGAASAQSYIIGAGYSGYVSRVRLADYALTQAEIGANTTENKIDKSHLEFFVDFTNSKPKDAGKHELLLACKHLCESRNIAEVFSFGSKGVISVLQSPPIAQNFSIITKIYIPLAAINDSALLCYNTATEKLTFGIKNNRLTCSVLGQELTATTPLNTQRWIDAAVTLSGTSLVLYVDGTQAAASTLGAQFSGLNGSLYLGNDVTAGNPGSMAFGGFMDMLAIFDAALPQATLQSFVTTPPFIFDEHISALYIGANGNPKNDLISGSTLSFTGDASVKLVENTTFQPTIPPFTFTSKSYSPPSPYYHWEAAAFCDILAENAADSYGLRPRYEIGGGQYPDSMLAFVSAIIMSNPSAQNIVVNRANLTTDALTGACDAVESGGGFSTLFKCLFMDFAIGAATAGTYYYMRAKSKTTAATAAMAVFAAILVTVIPKIVLSPPIKQPDEKPPVIPWPPYRTPKPEYRRGLSLDSISINHGTSGSTSVNIKSGTNTPITAPEWTAAKAVPSRALYIQSDIAVPVWKCAFTYSVIVIGATTPPPPCSVTVDGTSESVIGNFSATLKLPSAGSYSLDVSLSSSTIKTCVIGKYSVKVDWKATFSTGEILPLGTSVFTIYVLPTLPLAPFSVLTGQTSNWVSAPLLDLLATYLNKNMYLVTRAAFAPCVRNDAKFAPADTSVYSTLPDTDLGVPADAAFKLDTLLEAYTTGNISLSALDAALLLALLCRACGTTANLFRLRCGLMKMQGVDGKWLYPTFKLSPSSRLSETTFTEKLCLSEHYVVCASATEDYTANVSDPFYKFKVAAYTVTPDDMPYSNLDTFFVGEADKSLYRESLTQQGQLNALWNVVTQISLN